jgi:hypothetical protein
MVLRLRRDRNVGAAVVSCRGEAAAPRTRQLMGAEIRAKGAARRPPGKPDRAEAQVWSVRMEGYGGPAQRSPTIAQCLNGGIGWLEVECHRCKTLGRGPPLDAIRRRRQAEGRRGIFYSLADHRARSRRLRRLKGCGPLGLA